VDIPTVQLIARLYTCPDDLFTPVSSLSCHSLMDTRVNTPISPEWMALCTKGYESQLFTGAHVIHRQTVCS